MNDDLIELLDSFSPYKDAVRDGYYRFLLRKIGFTEGVPSIRGFDRNPWSYQYLIGLLHEKEFYTVLDNDQNRLDDCFNLRNEYSCRTSTDLAMSASFQLASPAKILSRSW